MTGFSNILVALGNSSRNWGKKKKVTDLVKKWSIGDLLLVSDLSGRQRQRVVRGKLWTSTVSPSLLLGI